MSLTLHGYVTPTWEDVAPEVTVSSVGIKHTFKAHQVELSRIYYDKLIWHGLCAMYIGGSVLEFWLCIQVRSPVGEITLCIANET